MPNSEVEAVEDELFNSFIAIEAAEDWSKDYAKTPEQHAKLIRTSAKLERNIRRFFKELSQNTSRFINWGAYAVEVSRQVHAAYTIDTIVKNDDVKQIANTFMKVVFEEIATGIVLGAQSGEQRYRIRLGITYADEEIQRAARESVAKLVGMRVLKNGDIIPNPNKAYSITDKIIDDIRSSIQTSIGLGENVETATSRIQNVIANPTRAETIARTETVNAFNTGLGQFAVSSGAVGHEWQDNGAEDVCAENAALGPIPIGDSFSDSQGNDIDGPAAHPNCRCIKRLIYQNELDENPKLFDS